MTEDAKSPSFSAFLAANRSTILMVLLVAFAIRVVLAVGFPQTAGDEPRYRVPAVNMLAGRGFSSDVAEPILPSYHTVPLYPAFIAGVFAIFGQHNAAVRIAQGAVDLITCLLVAFISFALAPPKLKELSALAGLIIYACLCWFTLSWTRYILTETLATFVTMLAVTVSAMVFRNEKWRWPAVGAICGIALMVRADSVLLVFAFGLFLLFQIARLRSSTAVANLVFFCLAIGIVLVPWTIRNYVAFGELQPLSNSAGLARGGYVPWGYIRWIRTWMADQTHYKVYHPAIFPGSRTFDARELPDEAFDSPEERSHVVQLIDQYNQLGQFTPDLDSQFQVIAGNRIKRMPLRFFVWLPMRRIAGMWLTGFATKNPFNRFLRILLVLPILVGGLAGFSLWARNSRLLAIPLLIISTRTLFFGFINSSEHYIVEAYPLVIAACGVTVAALATYVGHFWLAKARRL